MGLLTAKTFSAAALQTKSKKWLLGGEGDRQAEKGPELETSLLNSQSPWGCITSSVTLGAGKRGSG